MPPVRPAAAHPHPQLSAGGLAGLRERHGPLLLTPLDAGTLDGRVLAVLERAEAQDRSARQVNGLVVTDLTAAWVHDARSAPAEPFSLATPRGARKRQTLHPGLSVRERSFGSGEVITLRRGAVTTLERTAYDLFFLPDADTEWHQDAAGTVQHLLRQHTDPAAAWRHLCHRIRDNPQRPGSRLARQRLEEFPEQR